MKRYFWTILAVMGLAVTAGILAGCENTEQTSAQSEATIMKPQMVKLNVEGMTCGSCVKHVDTALANQDGVLKKQVSLETNSCEVEFDASKTNTEAIVATIEEAGYQASLAN